MKPEGHREVIVTISFCSFIFCLPFPASGFMNIAVDARAFYERQVLPLALGCLF
jgi:hypothetical protein